MLQVEFYQSWLHGTDNMSAQNLHIIEHSLETHLRHNGCKTLNNLICKTFTDRPQQISQNVNNFCEKFAGGLKLKAIYLELTPPEEPGIHWSYHHFAYDIEHPKMPSEDFDWLNTSMRHKVDPSPLSGLEDIKTALKVASTNLSKMSKEQKSLWRCAQHLVLIKFFILLKTAFEIAPPKFPLHIMATGHNIDVMADINKS